MKSLNARSVFRVLVICFTLLYFNRAAAQQVAAQNDLFDVLESSCSYYLDVEANDNLDTFSVIQLKVVSQPAHGSSSLNGNYITYCPLAGYQGADKFTYSITGGSRSDTATVYLNVQPFNNFVFPGDADQNGKVENFDVLAIGLTYSATGPSRQDSSALNALAWPPSPFINTNPGAADCDGNGIVDSPDVSLVAAYYNSAAPFGNHYNVDTSICNNGTPFYIQTRSGDSVINGDTLHIIINLGTDTSNQAYGIAFTLDYDTTFIPRNSIQFSTNSSWLLQTDRGLFFNRESETPGRIDLALTKTNQKTAHGGGPVLTAFAPIDDNICGINHAPGWYNLLLKLSKPRLINQYNEVQNLCITQPSIMVYKSLTVINEENKPAINVYPNPANDEIFIRAENIERVDITDLTGRKVYSAPFDDAGFAGVNIKSLGIEAGAYIVHVKTATDTGVAKIIIQ